MDPLNLASHAVGQSRPELIVAEVSGGQPQPAAFSDPLFVVFPQWHPENFWRVDNWPAIHGNTLPTAGAECLVVKNSAGAWRCVWWDGAHS